MISAQARAHGGVVVGSALSCDPGLRGTRRERRRHGAQRRNADTVKQVPAGDGLEEPEIAIASPALSAATSSRITLFSHELLLSTALVAW